ncbi:hypothetical protein [Candidatus Electronema sp. PJ]|uniref:hypothetical protein n=1 Tax=Candidatus Electronema sp. PJ TaxID=3401572 RepID=UPI003AA7E2E5
MTTKKRLAILAAAGALLTLTGGTVYAANVCCTAGTVKAAGSVYYNFTTGFTVKGSHSATLTCDQALPDWDGSLRKFELIGTTKDAMLAAALTALADDKKVAYCLTDAKEPSLLPKKNQYGHVVVLEATDTPLQ